MAKYFIIICALIVVAACGTTGDEQRMVQSANDEISNTDDTLTPATTDDGSDVATDDGSVSDTGSDATTDTTPVEPTGEGVAISGTIPASFFAGNAISAVLTASGGSGGFEWVAISFPDWLRLDPAAGDSVTATLVGTAPADSGDYRIQVRACDVENESNCATKTYHIKVQKLMMAMTRVLRPMTFIGGASGTCGSKPVITEPSATLSDSSANTGTLGRPLPDKTFKVTGGVGPYEWVFTDAVEDEVFYCAYHDCGDGGFMRSAWSRSEVDDDDSSLFHIKGSFMNAIHSNVTVCDDAGVCTVDPLVDTLKLKVKDSCGTWSDEKAYNFNLRSPDDTINNLFVETRLQGYHVWEGQMGKHSTIYFEMYDANDKLIAKTQKFEPHEGSYATWQLQFTIVDSSFSGRPHTDVAKLKAYLHDDKGCGEAFFVRVDYVALTGKFWSIFDDGYRNWKTDYQYNCAVDDSNKRVDAISPFEWRQNAQIFEDYLEDVFPSEALQEL
jgi:hypothetical protein